MKIAYMSITGNVKSFIRHLDVLSDDFVEIADNINPIDIDDKYLLIVPTYDEFMTESIIDFIEINSPENCLGIIGSGNKNFGDDGYIFTAKNLSNEYGIPILHDFEYGGMDSDFKTVNKIIQKLNGGKS